MYCLCAAGFCVASCVLVLTVSELFVMSKYVYALFLFVQNTNYCLNKKYRRVPAKDLGVGTNAGTVCCSGMGSYMAGVCLVCVLGYCLQLSILWLVKANGAFFFVILFSRCFR
ncbi:hypothetical protein E2542_SST19203 [Spatholobus suberectus]|nr:hypothetical protein E2542_SST19203 [Spatholobus suberectus]